MYNTSHTTVHHILQYLSVRNVLALVRKDYVIACKPEQNDGFDYITASLKEQNCLLKQVFFTMINLCQLHAGESFSEPQLVRAASVSPVVVRECLLKFGHYNLTQSGKYDQWSMKQFDQSHAEQLLELCEILEAHSLQHFPNLPDDDPRWLQAKTTLERHRTLRDSIGSNFRMFSQLDRDLHVMLLSAADSISFNQSSEITSVTFHSHYQWDESDLKQHNIIVVGGHMIILSALVCRSDLDTIAVL